MTPVFRALTAVLMGLALLVTPAASQCPLCNFVVGGNPNQELEEEEAGGGIGAPYGADEWMAMQRSYPNRTADLGQLRAKAAVQAQAVRASTFSVQAAWSSLGPSNVGGRVTDLVVDPVRSNTVYAGAASGGLWKSTNGGSSFSYSWDITFPQSIGALAITPSGVLYAGTGEGNPGGGSASFPGNGVYKSSDGGVTWTFMGLAGTNRIGRIVIDPNNSSRIFAAAAGNLFVPGGARGLYRSTDAGATWQLVLAGANSTTGAIDLAISTTDVYVSMWDHKRLPGSRQYGGVGSGLYRSSDGGTTWARMGGGLPASSTNLGRMGVAVAKSNANRLYAIAANTTGNFLGMWTSTNKGTSWTQLTNTGPVSSSQSTFGWWFGRIFIDPLSSSHLWVPGVPLVESTNAGGSWSSSSSSFHVDQHAMAFDPLVANRVFLGNDGGIYRSTANGSLSGGWSKATNLANMQFYTIAVSKQDISRVSGGTQDNGSRRSWASWGSYWGGDGLQNLIDPTNQLKVYACSQNGSCGRSTNGGTNMSSFGATTASRRAWLTPVAFDPSNPSIMYYGGERLNRSTNSAQSWVAISPDLSRGSSGSSSYNTISTIAVAPTNSAVIYVGTDDGRMWITRNTGGTWTEITAGLPTRFMTRVTVDPTNADLAYVTVSGYTVGDTAAHVFRTTNGGATWQDISGNLPNAPVNDIVYNPQNRTVLYVATDVGVFTSSDTGATWTAVGTGLPVVPVMDLDATVSAGVTQLTAGTYGLGIYRTAV